MMTKKQKRFFVAQKQSFLYVAFSTFFKHIFLNDFVRTSYYMHNVCIYNFECVEDQFFFFFEKWEAHVKRVMVYMALHFKFSGVICGLF